MPKRTKVIESAPPGTETGSRVALNKALMVDSAAATPAGRGEGSAVGAARLGQGGNKFGMLIDSLRVVADTVTIIKNRKTDIGTR